MRLGSGVNGAVYLACREKRSEDCDYVVKVQPHNQQAKAELEAYLSLEKERLTPKLHAAWLCNGKMYLVLDRVFECSDLTRSQVKHKLDKLHRLGWLHVDVHKGNVMCDKKGRVVLIDFGWAVHKDDQPYRRHPTGRKTFEELKRVQLANLDALFA